MDHRKALAKEGVRVVPTCCDRCHCECGVLVHVDNGKVKVELYSSILERFGYGPLPYYQENPEIPVSAPELAKDYPLILITEGRHIVYWHGINKQIPWLREIVPYPTMQIHPQTVVSHFCKWGFGPLELLTLLTGLRHLVYSRPI